MTTVTSEIDYTQVLMLCCCATNAASRSSANSSARAALGQDVSIHAVQRDYQAGCQNCFVWQTHTGGKLFHEIK
jgi:hypothetical protein